MVKKLTLNPNCMSDQSGSWRFELMESGSYQRPMVSMENPGVLMQEEEELAHRNILAYTLTAITLGVIAITAWSAYKELGKMPEQHERFIRPHQPLENYFQSEEQPRRVTV